jgi:Ca-activated chloride channel family protein
MSALSERIVRLFSWPVGASTLELAAPWALLLLAVPFLAFLMLPPYEQRQPALRVPFVGKVAESVARRPETGAVVLSKALLQWLVAPVVFVLLVAAAARPELVLPPMQKTEAVRDLLLAVDISESMQTPDFVDAAGRRLQRLEAVKQVLAEFVSRREGDRVGLVVFGDGAHLQAPFTLDHELDRQLLGELRVGMAGSRTMIGDSIGLAIKLFEESRAKQKVVVLLTDGNDSGSKVPPRRAAEIAKSRGITIHTVGIGDPRTRGADLVDSGTLAAIAEATGGATFLALDPQQLEGICRKLDEIEKVDLRTASYRPRRPLFHWPLAAAIVLLLAFCLVLSGVHALAEARA